VNSNQSLFKYIIANCRSSSLDGQEIASNNLKLS